MSSTYKALRKIAVFLVGFTVVVAGIILLPLPGPGLLVIVTGLIILSSEFEWAEKYLKTAKKYLRDMYQKAKQKRKKHK